VPALVRFLTTADGVRIAYRSIGGGHPLIFVRGWISHLELLGQEPRSRAFFEALASARTVIQYDSRGNGLSDRNVRGITLDQLVLDLEAVADHLSLDRFDLYGQCFGGPIAVSYTVARPQRVSSLILDGTYSRGRDITTPERQAALLAGIRAFWSTAAKMLDHLTVPDPDATTGYLASKPDAISADVAAELYDLAYHIDISDLLPKITPPTLVIHRRGSQAIPFRLGRALASSIPDARFVPLEGTSHNPWAGDTASVLSVVGDFLGVPLKMKHPVISSSQAPAPVTILFTDMESSTANTRRLGDSAAQELVRAHNSIVRGALKDHAGSEIKHTGDGIMASFRSASNALACAIAIQRGFAHYNESNPEALVRARLGLNSGEPLAEDNDLFGTSVQLAARICARAQPGQILASNVVRELAAGKGFLFSDCGQAEVRGFEDPVHLYEVNWRS